MAKKITQLPAVTKLASTDYLVVVDATDTGTKKILQTNVLKSEDAQVITSDLDDPLAIEIEATDPDGGVAVNVNGTTKIAVSDGLVNIENVITLQVPAGFNATNPGITVAAFQNDVVGLNWYGTPGVDSRLEIAGRLNCFTGSAHIVPVTDKAVDLGDLTTPKRFQNLISATLLLKKHDAYAGSEKVEETAAIRTTDATPAHIFTKTLTDNRMYWFEVKLVCRDEAGGADRGYIKLSFRVHRQSAGVATLGSFVTVESDVSGVDAEPTVSGNDLRITVTGVAAKNISWAATVAYQGVTSNA